MRKIFVFTLLLCIGQSPIFAQIELNEVSVTAKTPERKSILGCTTATSYVTDSTIRANAHLTLPQLLSQQTGIVVNGATQTRGSVQTVYFRGASRGLVLILINGIPVSDGSDIDQVFDLNSIALNQVQRIEILRGGQSVVYGSDAVGGVINIITHDSPNAPFSLTANAAYGSFNDIRAGLNLSGKSKGFTYQTGYNKQSYGGISAASTPINNPNAAFENDGFNQNAFHAAVQKKITSQISAYGNLRYANYQADFDASAFTDDQDNIASSKNLQFGFGTNYNFKKGLVNISYNRTTTERIYEDDSTDVPTNAFNKYSYATYGSTNDFWELYTNIDLTTKLNVLFGTDYQKVNTDQTYRSVSSFGEFVSPTLSSDLANLSNLSAYITANYVHNFIGIELGGRINNNSNYGVNTSYSINPYFQKNGFKVYGILAKSYKNPSLYQVFSEYGNRDLKPQEALSFDIGTAYEIEKSLTLGAVFFNRTTTNLFFFNSINVAPFGQYINLDAQTENGIELEASKKWQKIQLNGNYTRLLSTKTLVGTEKERLDNLNFLRRPKNVLNAGLTYQPTPKLLLNTTIQHQSARKDRFFNSETFSSELVDLQSFTLVSLQTSYKFTPKIKVGFSVNNLFNQNYFEIYGYNSLPRNYAINTLVSF